MSRLEGRETVAGDDEYLQSSVLDILVPSERTVDLLEYFKKSLKGEEQTEGKSVVTSLAERSFLFFGWLSPLEWSGRDSSLTVGI